MPETADRAIAIVGVGAILPDAPTAPAFWRNVTEGRYSISDVRPERWDPARYYDADPHAPDKTYSAIGGWVREWEWDPIAWKLPIPPRVSDAMDDAQKWAVACSREALADYGWPQRPLALERTAVIMGNAMAGEKHYLTALRIMFPEYAAALREAPSFAALPVEMRAAIAGEFHARIASAMPDISEDTMPGELGNIIAGRVANLFNLHGPNYVTDAACASAMAAMSAAVEGLIEGDYDAVLTGGVDRNMGASTFVKFSKIGALSATGTRPYADGADGFVMGEGAAVFLFKRLADAERDGDHVHAVLRGIAGASDGKGKGITAPNPVGQRLAVERAWRNAGLPLDTVGLVEGHGTSTRVGDVVEVESLSAVFGAAGLAVGSVPLGSVKSNIGHLKGAAGAAGVLKAVLALRHQQLPPSLNFERPNPAIDFGRSPFAVNTTLRDWPAPPCGVRRAGVSAFGFGGTNFHVVLEEFIPGRLQRNGRTTSVPPALERPAPSAPVAMGAGAPVQQAPTGRRPPVPARAPLRGALVLGGACAADLRARLERLLASGVAPPPAPPAAAELAAPERLAIDYGDAAELADKGGKALKALTTDDAAVWKALRAQGIFRGRGGPGKVAFLFTGQGSQYVNMLADLRRREPLVAAVFAAADRIMTPLLGKGLSEVIFVDAADAAAVAQAEEDLRQTAITQPAVLAADTALTHLLAAYGVAPDMVMGHSLGEYGALVAAEALPFADALEAVSARGREMSNVSMGDNGKMAAVFAPLSEVERILAAVDGYVVIANINSHGQAVVGGASDAVDRAVEAFTAAGHMAVPLPVSHAFHTRIVAPASVPLRATLERLHLAPPRLPIVANVDGAFYPTGDGVVPRMLDILARQVAEPVQFIKGLETLYAAGARVFVEVGPKKALHGFVEDVLGGRGDVQALFTNHPKQGDLVSFNQALCGLYAAGIPAAAPGAAASAGERAGASAADGADALSGLFSDFLARARDLYQQGDATPPLPREAVVVSGAALGLPGTPHVFDDGNLATLLHGAQLIDVIPSRLRHAILDKHITRVVKNDDGSGSFEEISSPADVIKLAARAGVFDITAEFGLAAERVAAYDIDTMLAIGAGLDALRDAGIPLVMRYRTTHKGTRLPAGWALPEALRDDTGILFASAFPGYDAFADEMQRYHQDRARRQEVEHLEHLRARLAASGDGGGLAVSELDRHLAELRDEIARHPYAFDRRFLFRVLSMGHSQFAELIGARGPNTQINSACASTTQAFAVAEDWIRAGRCRRVIVIAADDATSEHMLEWVGAGFLASGAAATDEDVADAALPFDRRRHGTLLGMGAAAFVFESAGAARERGVQPICELLGAVTANSAFHGTRLDVEHICQVMEGLVAGAERRWGLTRQQLAPQLVFISHETYTPARGGSAAAEVHALRTVFGPGAEQIVVANTKGFTGHPMGVGIEDVVAVKALETGLVPPIPNYREVDPELGTLNLSRGGAYPIRYALRLGAGFGSQISMTLLRWVPTRDGRHRAPQELGFAYRIADQATWQTWLDRVTGETSTQLEVVNRTLRVTAGAAAAARVELPVREQQSAGSAGVPPAGSPLPPAAAAPAAEPTALPAAADPVRERVLALVAEKTGYPTDMLDPELDLEADLGVDTVKQAELFAAVREIYDIPRDDKLKLRDFPTLNHVFQFVRDRAPNLPQGPPAGSAGGPPAVPPPAAADFTAVDAVPRRVPVPVLRPPLDLCKPTGVTLAKGSRVVVMLDNGGVGKALTKRLEKLGAKVLAITGAPTADELTARLTEWSAAAPVQGVYWLPALDAEGDLAAMDLAAWREALRLRVKLLCAAMRALYEQVASPGTFLVAATRLGGQHGYDAAGATQPLGGAVTGFTKTYKRERPTALVKAVDFPTGGKAADVAEALIEETRRDPGAVEIGRSGAARWSVALVEQPVADGQAGMTLGRDSVFVVTGAAGSITSAITADLAAASAGTFYLLDLAPAPEAGNADLQRFAGDREGLKRDLFERLKARGERATPAAVEKELAGLERQHAALSAIQAVERAGGTARYHRVDLRDAAAVAAAIADVRQRSGRVDVLLHAGGLEISRFLPDKSAAEFDLVFDVKADGWFNLLHAIGDMPLGATVAFSSIAGRFGNGGQADYAAANDLLCKMAASFRTSRPETRGIAVDWTAWGGIGMATRGSIPKMMELAGIDMLPPSAGIPFIRRELTAGGRRGEVLVGQRLGLLLDDFDREGGLDPAAVTVRGPMLGRVCGMGVHGGLVVETVLDPGAQPFLHDHQIDGTPVLPGVMGLEAFAELATLVAPDWSVIGIEDVEFLAPCKFYRNDPRTLTLTAQPRAAGDQVVVDCRLSAARQLAGQAEPQVTTHFTARVRLARKAAKPVRGEAPAAGGATTVGAPEIYQIYFHGPAYQVLRRAWRVGERVVGELATPLPANHAPAEQPTRIAPRLIELCFQTAGIWEMGTTGRLALPLRIAAVEALAPPPADPGAAVAVVTPRDGAGFDAEVVDGEGRVVLRLRGYRTVVLPSPVEADKLAPLTAAMQAAS